MFPTYPAFISNIKPYNFLWWAGNPYSFLAKHFWSKEATKHGVTRWTEEVHPELQILSVLESYFFHPLCDFPSSFCLSSWLSCDSPHGHLPMELIPPIHRSLVQLSTLGVLSCCSLPPPLAISLQHHAALFSLNFNFPVRANFRGYKQQNNAELPNQPLSNSCISYLPTAASCAIFVAKTLNKKYTSSVCHLPLHLCCSQHGP